MSFGIHVDRGGKTIDKAVDAAYNEYGPFTAFQFFIGGPRSSTMTKDYEAVKTIDLEAIVHSSYVSSGVWNAKNERHACAHIIDQLRACASCGVKTFVLHLPKAPIEDIVETMSFIEHEVKTRLKNCKPPTIALEIISTKPTQNTSYETPDKLNALIAALTPIKIKWGICVDTAHLWGCGVDISTYGAMRDWFGAIKRPKKIKVIHLNGSLMDFGVHKDQHAIALTSRDKIWGHKVLSSTGFYAAVEFARENDIPCICEINYEDKRATKDLMSTLKRLF